MHNLCCCILVCYAEQRWCAPRGKQLALKASSVYRVVVRLEQQRAYCDMKTGTGGWTVIQRLQDGSVNFYREWAAYKAGFGSLTGEFWWGLEKIHLLTSSHPHELRINMVTRKGKRIAATYSSFRVDSEKKKYKLHISGFKGYGAKDTILPNNGMAFRTFDCDNDRGQKHYARIYRAAWWYYCYYNSWFHRIAKVYSNLNKKYGSDHLQWNSAGLKFVEMKIRPRN